MGPLHIKRLSLGGLENEFMEMQMGHRIQHLGNIANSACAGQIG